MSSSAIATAPAPAQEPARAPAAAATAEAPAVPTTLLIAFVGGHVVLALMMRAAHILSTAHALFALLAGVLIAVRYPPRFTAFTVAYFTGCEVLWRMTKGAFVWELGKYGVCLVLLIALFRMRKRRNVGSALLYFGLLLPSALLTVTSLDLDNARQLLSFNLSGPLSLALCVLFFSNIKITHRELRWIYFAVIGPVTAIASLGLFSILTHKKIDFINASNAIAAGGFGPNQVSSVLGLGLLFALLVLMERKVSWRLRALLIGLSLFFAAQSALTFSRSGIVLALSGAAAAGVFLMRDRRARITFTILASLFFVAGKYLLVPQLEDFTENKINQRYGDLDTDGRTKLAAYDLQIFEDHPILGVGPGMASAIREEMGHFAAAHTEFTRLLAEHGLAGAAALIVLLVLGLRTLRTARVLRYRALVCAMLAWTGLFMMVNGMRIVAPSFVLGMACAIAYSFKPPPRPKVAKAS